MNQDSKTTRVRKKRVLDTAFVVGLLVAAVMTGRSLTSTSAARAAQPTPAQLTLDGGWETVANGDRVNRLLRDDDVIWSATDGGGLVRWDLSDDSYRQYLAPQDGLRSNQVNDLVLDDDGTLWLATEGGLSRLDPTTGTVENITPATSPGMPTDVVRALELDPEGRLWVGFGQKWDPDTEDPKSGQLGTFLPGGLARFDPASGTWDAERHARVDPDADEEVFFDLTSENITTIDYGTDDVLWIGTRPYYTWDPNSLSSGPGARPGYWVLAGGGLTAHYPNGRWQNWRSYDGGQSVSCYPVHVTDLEADEEGRMWVGTAGQGLLLMLPELRLNAKCTSGQRYYTRGRRDTLGLRGNTVWSVDIDEDGRVWIGHGEGMRIGRGVSVLDHNGTFHDSSASDQPWNSDDVWVHLDLDGVTGESTVQISALEVGQPGPRYMGTRDEVLGDGVGLRRFVEDGAAWTPLTTAEDGLPSNQISHVAHHPGTGDLWISLRNRGVARFDGQQWSWWRMFEPGEVVGRVRSTVVPDETGVERIPVDIATQAAFDAAFPARPWFVRIGDDPTRYRITSYQPDSGDGASIDVTPPVAHEVTENTELLSVQRGPPSDTATDIAFDPNPERNDSVYVGGRETLWQRGTVESICPRWPECWLDGGLGEWDGSYWTVYEELEEGANAADPGLPDQEVQAVTVDLDGRVWVGTGIASKAEGDGIGVYDPVAKEWVATYLRSEVAGLGGNAISAMAVDPETGHIWTAHHLSEVCQSAINGEISCADIGGGVARFDGTGWQSWNKHNGATMDAFGTYGEMSAIAVDRRRDLIVSGGWAASETTFHALRGIGVHAVVNWCPLDSCTNGAWQHTRFEDDGRVSTIAVDADGRLWVGTTRDGRGIIPQVGGVKLTDDLSTWATYNATNSGLPSSEITALEANGEDVWVGTMASGLAVYRPGLAPTPTTAPPTDTPGAVTDTPVPGGTEPTPTPVTPTSPTASVSPTQTSSPGPGTPELTPTPTATTAPPSPTPSASPQPGQPVRWPTIYLPFTFNTRANPDRPLITPRPTPTRPTITPPPTATATSRPPTATPTATPTVTPSPTSTASPSPTATANMTPAPTSTRQAP